MRNLSFIPVMNPTLVDEPPEGLGWIHEIKHDGYRTQLVIDGSGVRLFTRNGFDWSDRYAAVASAAGDLNVRSTILDGEMIVQDVAGRSDYEGFRRAMSERPHDLVFMAFDLLHLDGRDVRREPLEERRARLRDLVGCNDPECRIQYSEAIEGRGAEVFAAAERMGLEGVVSKKLGSRYVSGRTTAWLKAKTYEEAEFVVIGTERDTQGPSCALLAREGEDGLIYRGSAFVTLPARHRELFWRRADELAAGRPPLLLREKKTAAWLRPEMRVRAKYLRGEGKLRHATLTGVL